MSLEWIDIDGVHSKVDIAIERLRTFENQAINFDPEGYYVCDSGGKDSTVIKQLCIDAGVKFAVYNHHTTVDHPETVYFIRREKKRFEDMGYKYEITHNYDKNGKRVTMWSLIEKRGFPTRTRRFCCSELKETGGDGRVIVTGVRREESTKRRSRGIAETIEKKKSERIVLNNDNDDKREFLEHCLRRHKVTVNPIINWTEQDVWEYIRSKGLPYNPLYDRGYKRIGCVGCPMGDNRYELENNPKYKQAYIHAFERYLKTHAYLFEKFTMKTSEEWYDWWTKNIRLPSKDQITAFDEVFGDDDDEED